MNQKSPLPGIRLFDLTGRTALLTGGSKDSARRWLRGSPQRAPT
jgi:hypothetical protein